MKWKSEAEFFVPYLLQHESRQSDGCGNERPSTMAAPARGEKSACSLNAPISSFIQPLESNYCARNTSLNISEVSVAHCFAPSVEVFLLPRWLTVVFLAPRLSLFWLLLLLLFVTSFSSFSCFSCSLQPHSVCPCVSP